MATKKQTDDEKKTDDKNKKPSDAKSKKTPAKRTASRGAARRSSSKKTTPKTKDAPAQKATASAEVTEEKKKPTRRRRPTKKPAPAEQVDESNEAQEAQSEETQEKPKPKSRRSRSRRSSNRRKKEETTQAVEASEQVAETPVEPSVEPTVEVTVASDDAPEAVVTPESQAPATQEAKTEETKTEDNTADDSAPVEAAVEEKPKPVLRPAQYQKQARIWLEALFDKMNLDVSPKCHYDKNTKTLSFDLVGEGRLALLGRNQSSPKAIEAIEKLLHESLDLHNTKYKLSLDVNDFRKDRTARLQKLAENLAKKSQDIQRAFVVAGLNDFERRVVHNALTDNKDIKTESEGNGTFRKLRITPRRKDKS